MKHKTIITIFTILIVLSTNPVNCSFFKSIGKGISKGFNSVKHGVVTGAKATAHGVSTAAKATAHGVVTGAKATAHGVSTAAKATAHGVSTAAKATSHFIVKGAKNTVEGAKKVTNWVKNVPKSVTKGVKKLKSKDFLSILYYFMKEMKGNITIEKLDETLIYPVDPNNKKPSKEIKNENIPEKVQFLKDQLSPLQDTETRKIFMTGFISSLTTLQNSPECKEVVSDLIPTLPIINSLIEMEFLHSKRIKKEEILKQQSELKQQKKQVEDKSFELKNSQLNAQNIKDTMLMMDKLSELDQVTSQAFNPTKYRNESGQIKLITSAEKEQCVMDNIIPLKTAILKILLYSDILSEQKESKSKNSQSQNSLFNYFNQQELPVMQQVTLALSEALVLLKLGMVEQAGIKTGAAVQRVMDIKLVDYGVDSEEEQKLDKVDMIKCGQYWYEGVQEIQELEFKEKAMESEEAPEDTRWVDITKKVREKCLETSTQ